MTLYAIYAKPDRGPEALSVLRDGFSWMAFLFAPLWAIGRGAVLYFIVWCVVAGGLVWAIPLVGPGAALGLYGVFALWTGFAATSIAGRALLSRDWIETGELTAPDKVTAERLWLERTYGGAA